jgi:hypothetical protein
MSSQKRIKVELAPELYSKVSFYLEKLKGAESVVELNHYYKKIKRIIESSIND